MKKFIRIISYIREYKAQMGWYSLCITLSILFGLFSLGMLMPFMDLIFGSSELTGALKTTTAVGGNKNIKDVIYGFLQQTIHTHGKTTALGWICAASRIANPAMDQCRGSCLGRFVLLEFRKELEPLGALG